MSLHQFLLTLRRGWPVILAGLLLGAVPGLLLSKMMTPSYQTTASAMIALPAAKTLPDLQQGDVVTQSRARTYADLAGSRLVLDKVAKQLGLQDGTKVPVTAAAEPQTAVITLVSTDADPQKAAEYANATMEQLIATVPQVDGDNSNLIKIVELSPAVAPTVKSSPQGFLYMAIGAVLGLTIGFLAAYLWVLRRFGRADAPAAGARGGATRGDAASEHAVADGSVDDVEHAGTRRATRNSHREL